MLCRISVSLIAIVLLWFSSGFCEQKAFIDAPSTCHEVEKVEGDTVYLKADKSRMCIQALNKVTVLLQDNIERVKIFVDGVFWKEQDLKTDYSHLVDRAKDKETIEKYSSLVKEEYLKDVKKYEYLKENVDMAKVQDVVNKNKTNIDREKLKEIFKQRESTKVLSIFYLFSQSVPDSIVDTVFLTAKKLPQDVAFYGVLRGIDRDRKILQKLMNMQNFPEIEIKIHPFIFRELHVERVPAVVFGYCPPSEMFEFEKCDLNYIIYGDISLKGALELVADKDEAVRKLYKKIKNDF